MGQSTSTDRSGKSRLGGPQIPPRMPADHVGTLIAALVLMGVGWGGLAVLVLNSPPRIGAELWVFFLLLHMAITGTVLPAVRYLNVRLFPITEEPPPGGVIVRQSIWIGLFVVACAWLQILRVLSIPIGVGLALLFIVVEVFLRTRELNDDE